MHYFEMHDGGSFKTTIQPRRSDGKRAGPRSKKQATEEIYSYSACRPAFCTAAKASAMGAFHSSGQTLHYQADGTSYSTAPKRSKAWGGPKPGQLTGDYLREKIFDAIHLYLTDARIKELIHKGDTQCCEAMMRLVMKFCPKHIDFTRSLSYAQRCAYAVLYRNEGFDGALQLITERLNFPMGKYTKALSAHKERQKQRRAELRKDENAKARRVQLRFQKHQAEIASDLAAAREKHALTWQQQPANPRKGKRSKSTYVGYGGAILDKDAPKRKKRARCIHCHSTEHFSSRSGDCPCNEKCIATCKKNKE